MKNNFHIRSLRLVLYRAICVIQNTASEIWPDVTGDTGDYCSPYPDSKKSLAKIYGNSSFTLANVHKGYDATCGLVNGKRFYKPLFSADAVVENESLNHLQSGCTFAESYKDYCEGVSTGTKSCRGYVLTKSTNKIFPPANAHEYRW